MTLLRADDTAGVLDLTRSEEFRALRSAVHSLATDRIAGAPTDPDRSARPPQQALDALDATGLLTPRRTADGGQGVPGVLEWTVIAEELGKADAGTALDVVGGAYAAAVVGRCGTAGQRRVLAPGNATSSSPRGTILYFEGFGRSPLDVEATVRPTGDGALLSGRKTAVVRAAESDFGVVVGRTAAGLAAVLLAGDAVEALTVVRDDGSAKIGARAAATSVVELSDAAGELLAGGSEIDLHRAVAGYRLAVASILLGTGQAAVTYAAGYAATREAFGQPIAGFQGVAFPLADADIGLDAARLAVWDLAADVDTIDDPAALADLTSVAVAVAAQAGVVATTAAVNTLGGHGYLTDHPVERWYRDAVVLAAVDFDPLLTDWSATR